MYGKGTGVHFGYLVCVGLGSVLSSLAARGKLRRLHFQSAFEIRHSSSLSLALVIILRGGPKTAQLVLRS